MKAYDFRHEGDKGGYKIFCDSCGQTSYVSEDHGRYCPICGRDTLTPITVEKIVPEGEKKLYVTFRVNARFVAEVTAADVQDGKLPRKKVDEIINLANEMFQEADFGPAESIDGEAIFIEDECGRFLWAK